MDLKSLIQRQKKNLKPTVMCITNQLGNKFEIFEGVTKELRVVTSPFIVDHEPDLRIAPIIPGLFLSSQDPIFCLDILSAYRIKHILSLGINPIIKFDNIEYHYMDVLDVPEFDITSCLATCIQTINSHIDENILVHCNAGVSRSPTIIIAYLMLEKNLTYKQAYSHVKAMRHCMRPNDGFARQLRILEKMRLVVG